MQKQQKQKIYSLEGMISILKTSECVYKRALRAKNK